ncbi:MAG: carboxymuconolactone decarboxylase family protein [Sandaracinaceae bacterium]|nr:carboxymuconolactone decarboxylase family protein [Sandaracinaceae bacterium]
MSEHYYCAHDLARFGELGENVPDLTRKFFDWYGAVFADGALGAREGRHRAGRRARAAVPYCIDAYTTGAMEKGADLDQLTEAVHVAAAIRGAPRWCTASRCATSPPRSGM